MATTANEPVISMTSAEGAPRQGTTRLGLTWPRVLLAGFFTFAGVMHFVKPEPYAAIIPPWLPNAPLLVALSGAFEILGGLGVLAPRTRRAAGWGLIALLIAVFPANVQMLHLAYVFKRPRSGRRRSGFAYRSSCRSSGGFGEWRHDATHERPARGRYL